MEFVKGKNLSQLFVENNCVMNIYQRKHIIRGILEGLVHMHEQYIVHRDIKPANIMIREDGAVKIVDLGLATDIRELKYIHIRCGTLGFIGPEILALAKNSTERMTTKSDIFSVGVIMYEILFKRSLFETWKDQKIVFEQNLKCGINFADIPYRPQTDLCSE